MGDRPKDLPAEKSFAGYLILYQTTIQDRELAGRLLAVLQDPNTYSDVLATCFTPGMDVRLQEGDRELSLVICLDCAQIEFRSDREPYQRKIAIQGPGIRALGEIYNQVFFGD